jgi:hypothetical protein
MKHFGVKRLMHFLAFLLVFAGIVLIVMLLWNALLPSIFGISAINYWQAAGLFILSRLLLGGFGKMGHGCFHGFHHNFHENHFLDKDLHDKIKGMSHHERREFIRKRMTGPDNEEK